MILNNFPISGWEDIRRNKQETIDKKNQNENKYIKLHNYIVRGKVIVHDNKAKRDHDP